MINVRIFANGASKGAVEVSNALRERGVKSTKVSFTSKEISLRNSDFLINWGSSTYPKWVLRKKITGCAGILNMPEYVGIAVNKLATFNNLLAVGVSIPEFATNANDAIAAEWKEIVCRTILNGSGGDGIVISDNNEIRHMDRCPLYVQYIKKTKEFRVHVFKGTIIDIQEKRKVKDFQGTIDHKIRSHSRGWVFCRGELEVPNEVMTAAIDAVDAINLDFGAVDIIWNRHYKKAYVLEINTAPGLEGTTIDVYAEAIMNHINNLE